MHKRLIGLIIAAVVLIGGVAILQIGNIGAPMLWSISNGGTWMFPLITVAALIDSINPCAFSVLLLTIAFLLSIGKMRASILKIGTVYILGLFTVYIAIGLGLLQALHIFNTPHFMAKVGAALLIVLGGINLINEFFPKFPIKLKIPNVAHHKMAILMEKGSAPTAFVLGVLVGLCEFPCTGGPYLMVLGLLHDRATYAKGLGYLLYYNILFVLPLVIILAIASNKLLLDKVQAWQKQERKGMRLWGGVAMIALGILIFLF
ncbi:MAG: cytochrome c biogenesis protein CcdA [bacterium]|nr:cytochrome c biogenesis protein CcdA [bacterium]